MLLIDPNTGQIIKANQAAAQYYGYPLEKMPQIKIQQLNILPPAEVTKEMRSALNKQFNIFEFRHLLADGKVRDVEVHSAPITIQNQKLLFSIVRDITERKRAEAAVRKSEQTLKDIFESTLSGYWDWNLVDNTEYLSPTFKRMFGYEDHEMESSPEAWQRIIFPEDLPGVLEVFDRHVKSLGREPFYNETRYRHRDGFTVWVICAGRVIEWDADGMAIRMVGCHIDITERKNAEAKKEKLQAQLTQAQKMESVGRLAGGVAHDFNNMLSIINGYAEISINTLEPEEPVYSNIQEIYKAGKRSEDIVRQLLAFARQQTISPLQLNLNDTISGMLKMLQRLISENIDLAWHPGKNLWPVKIDPSQVDQIMANLAVNARDAIEDVGKLIIETKNVVVDEDHCRLYSYFVPGRYVMLAVSDNGCGMEKEVQENLFEPFFTTKGVGKGTGLGMSTIYGIVKQNKGFINVYSEPGQGTTFKIYLPPDERKESFSSQQLKESAKQMPTGSETVMLVEDEPAILKMGKGMLEKMGYTVLTAAKPDDALRLAEEYEGKIQLLITDVVMPGMNGRDLSAKLSECSPGLKSIYMSGYTADVIAHHGVLDEGVHFIQKPFSIQDLAVKVREVIEQQ